METLPGPGLEGLVRALRGSLAVYDRLQEGLALYSPAGDVVLVNATIFQLVGEAPGPAATVDFAAYLEAEDKDDYRAAFAGVLQTGNEAQLETIFIARDRARINVAVRLIAARAGGNIAGVLAIVTDITAQTSAERLLLRSEQRFRSLFEHHPDPITIVSRSGTYKRINRAAEELSGFLNEELVGKTNEGVVAADRLHELDVVREKTARGEPAAFETTIVRRDGRRADLEGVAIPIVVDGVPDGFFSVTRDVTGERQRRSELATQSRRIHELYRVAASAGVMPQEQARRAIALGAEHLGFDVACITRIDDTALTVVYSTDTDVAQLRAGYTGMRERSLARYALESHGLFFAGDTQVAPWCDHPNDLAGLRSYVAFPLIVGSELYGTLSFASVLPRAELSEPDRDYIAAIATLSASAIERDLQGQKLDALAFYDALTGLPNRVLLFDRIGQLIAGARRYERSFAIHFVDLDYFKPINDTYGHAVGDRVLATIGKRLGDGLRDSDTLARFGGDEFVILQPEVGSPGGAIELAKRVAARFAKPFDVAGHTLEMTLSIGISMFPTDGADAAALIARADAALYRVKQDGRNAIRLYDPSLAEHE